MSPRAANANSPEPPSCAQDAAAESIVSLRKSTDSQRSQRNLRLPSTALAGASGARSRRRARPAVTHRPNGGGNPEWQRAGLDIPGATSASYLLPSATEPDNGATFRVIVTNTAGSVTSNVATLTVNLCAPDDTTCDGVDDDCDGMAVRHSREHSQLRGPTSLLWAADDGNHSPCRRVHQVQLAKVVCLAKRNPTLSQQ